MARRAVVPTRMKATSRFEGRLLISSLSGRRARTSQGGHHSGLASGKMETRGTTSPDMGHGKITKVPHAT